MPVRMNEKCNIWKAFLTVCWQCPHCGAPNWVVLAAEGSDNPRRTDIEAIKCWRCKKVSLVDNGPDFCYDGPIEKARIYGGKSSMVWQKLSDTIRPEDKTSPC